MIRDGVCTYVDKDSEHSHASDQENDYIKLNIKLKLKESGHNLAKLQILFLNGNDVKASS